MLAVGPRAVFRDRWLWLGALLAAALWAPTLVWQAGHGWPQLGMASQIATVGNGGSVPGWLFPVFQLVLISPLPVPVWVAGLWALARDPDLRRARAFAVAYGVLFAVLLAAGGKHYYLVGLYPLLLAAGAAPTLRWVRRGNARAGDARGGAGPQRGCCPAAPWRRCSRSPPTRWAGPSWPPRCPRCTGRCRPTGARRRSC